jgi:hypothetical protein
MLIASQISSVCLPLASGESFWVFMALCFALWGIFAAVAKTAEDGQNHAAATDRKRCRHCREEHPAFAAYCRQCGRRF